jgi:predicted AAA+ superfamily ATPase
VPKTLFEHVEPCRDVLDGVLSDSVFAASLDEVVAGTAPDTYGDATSFFNGTYPSAGLRSLLDEVLGRTSQSVRSVLRWPRDTSE